MTIGKRMHQIQKEERHATAKTIAMEYPEMQGDITEVMMVIQEAVNTWVQAKDRVMDWKVLPAALGYHRDELLRVVKRFQDDQIKD